MNKRTMTNVAIYLRVSTDLQDTLSQIDAIESWIKTLPVEKRPKSTRIFEDRGRSGKDTNRVGFQSMLDAAKNGEIDTIMCYKLDRFSRSASFAIRTILELDMAGVAFISTSQPVLNLGHENPFRRTMLSAFAEIAEVERETIVARVKAGLETAKKRGKKLGNPFLSEHKKKMIHNLWLEGILNKTQIAKRCRVSRTSVWQVLRSIDGSNSHGYIVDS